MTNEQQYVSASSSREGIYSYREGNKVSDSATALEVIDVALGQELHGREALDLELRTDVAVGSNVNFSNIDLTFQLGGNLFVYGGKSLTVTAPRSIELDQPITGGGTSGGLSLQKRDIIQHYFVNQHSFTTNLYNFLPPFQS